MNAWIGLLIGFLIQETVITDAAIFQARQAGINWIYIHTLWTVITIFHLIIPYYLTRFLINKIKGSRLGGVFIQWGNKIHNFLSRFGENWGLLIMGIINFVYLNSIIAAWLNIKFKKAFLFFFAGDLIWYFWVLGINMGVRSLIPDTKIAFLTILVVAFGISTTFKILFKKLIK